MFYVSNIRKFNNKKKILLVVILLVFAIISTINIGGFTSADNGSATNEESLASSVFEILNDVDLSEMQNMVDGLEDIGLFQVTIREKIESILKGEYFTDYSSLASSIISLLFGDIKSILPFVFTLIAIGILCNLISNMQSTNKSISDTISFVFLSVTMLIVIIAFKSILYTTNKTITLINTQMQIVFPILITLLASIGSIASVSI